jgi:cytidylate kinase
MIFNARPLRRLNLGYVATPGTECAFAQKRCTAIVMRRMSSESTVPQVSVGTVNDLPVRGGERPMNEHNTPERMSDTLALARKRWRRELEDELRTMPALPAAPPRWTIAFSREAGIDASAVARPLAESLGWAFYDRELVEEIARNAGLRSELVEGIDEVPTQRFSGMLDRFLGTPDRGVDRYLRSLGEIVCALAARGDCILVGRGAAVTLPAESTLAVLLVAPLATRVASLRSSSGLSERAARSEIERIDTERRQFVLTHFHKDPGVPSNYDLVLNVARLTPEQCVATVKATLQELQKSAGAAHRAGP